MIVGSGGEQAGLSGRGIVSFYQRCGGRLAKALLVSTVLHVGGD